ncbi:hypothetical protein ACNQF7_04320 [Flavobacterium sp. RSP29]|uniref:hypothetical protein n=1 Tax=Flavobacterium sp. RSP29 TaxID=3401731 RepID=UPI003AAD1BE6
MKVQKMSCALIAINESSSLQNIIKYNYNGFLIENNNFVEFAARAQILIDNQGLATAMARNGVLSSQKSEQDTFGSQ